MLTLFGRYYDLKVYETISQLCPPSRCRSTAGNLDRAGLRAVLGDSARVFKEIVSPYDAAVDPASFVDQTAAEESAAKDGKPLTRSSASTSSAQPAVALQRLPGRPEGHRPADHALPAPAAAPRPLALPAVRQRVQLQDLRARFKSDQMPPRSSTWPTSGTCSRRPTPTGWSGRSSTSSRPRAVGQVAGGDGGRPRRGLGPGREAPQPRQDQRPRPDVGAAVHQGPGQDTGTSTTATGSRSTCSRPSPTWSTSRCPGRWRALQTGEPTRTRTEKWWYDIPGRREVRDGPANWKTVLAGETDTLVRARRACAACTATAPPPT